MRLTEEQISAFIDTLSPYNFKGELRLHGSRVDDTARGGDIDLLLITNNQTECDLVKDNKYKILVAIKNKIGDQKIDLLITTIKKAAKDNFVQTILPTSKLIHCWS